MRKLVTFLLFAAIGATLCAFASLLSYDFFTTRNRAVPYSYSQFLLETIATPRIIIDAGSSSMFGVEPGLIEQAFRKPTIDVADNGSIPLDMKIYRMLKYAREGDILVVPLEWVYYTRDIVPLDFIDKTPDEYAAYYGSLPLPQRLYFAVRHVSLHNLSDAGRLYLRKDLRRNHLGRVRDEMSKWPNGDRKDDTRRRSSVTDINCADYIAAAGEIPPIVPWAAKQLSELQTQRKIRVYLAWPAVAGSDCYAMPNGRLPIADQVRAIFERNGITVIGEPADSYFAPEHMLDTYYHVDSSAARVRTERLIARLRDAGLKPGETVATTTAQLAEEALRKLEASMDPRDVAGQ
ncbi:hypothetical protein [Bradyrhizobium prioriisuperbiae]|uniref:hypothetical protein n=1 Tax=Bradyrhizobium prioriisuperbiae TaxID=2854389 RepID=UPI0028F0D449|nr:hypothetical protein [Bradyrhizobium prioritasuperba]